MYSARYGGLDSDPERCRLLLSNMRGATNRAAHFHTSIVCAFPNGDTLTAEGDCAGTIAFAPMGGGGFGYDPVFFVPSLRKTFAQLTAEEERHFPPGQCPAGLCRGTENVFGEAMIWN